MANSKVKIFPLGDSALTVEFGKAISTAYNEKAIALSDHFENNQFPGFIESVPAYSSMTIFYDLPLVRQNFPKFSSAFEAVKHLAVKACQNRLRKRAVDTSPSFEIPVHFDDDSALDLQQVAEHSGLSKERVIEIFTAVTYRVFMLGFLPGFSYMGEVDGRIATPRKASPHLLIPKGSVGIAGKQTGIYSLASPGGWQIIGRTDVEMFTPNAEMPSFLKPGDMVKFVAAR